MSVYHVEKTEQPVVVFQADVIVRMVLLDEIQLHDKGFLLRGSDIEVDIGDAGDHALYFGGEFVGGLKVRADTMGEVGGLTHIENRPLGVSHQVDAGTVGQPFELFFYQSAGHFYSPADNLRLF